MVLTAIILTSIFSISALPDVGDFPNNVATKRSGVNSLGAQNLLAGTIYCTGITTNALTLSSGSGAVLITGEFLLRDFNVTGQIYNVFVAVDTVSPSQGFGSGTCGPSAGLTAIAFEAPATGTTYNWGRALVYTRGLAVGNTFWASMDVQSLVTSSQVRIQGGSSVLQMMQTA